MKTVCQLHVFLTSSQVQHCSWPPWEPCGSYMSSWLLQVSQADPHQASRHNLLEYRGIGACYLFGDHWNAGPKKLLPSNPFLLFIWQDLHLHLHLHLHLQFTVFAFSTPISVRQMQFQFQFHFWSSCWSILGSISGSISAPKLVQKLFFWGSIFGTLSFEVLKVFKCLLGAFLSLLCSSWEASGPQKPWKTNVFF